MSCELNAILYQLSYRTTDIPFLFFVEQSCYGARRSVVVAVTDESNDGIIYEFAFVGTVGEVFDSNLIYPGMHGTFSQSLSLSQ